MTYHSVNSQRVLAIDPCAQGLGFAVLEGPERLIDYEVKTVGRDKNSASLKKVAALIERYQPEMIVLENPKGKGSRRSLRVQELTDEILQLASSKRINARSFSREQIKKAFSSSEAFTKHQIASAIVKQFPALALRLPPPRKPWRSEKERMSIFDAIALALTFFLGKPS